VVSVDLRTRTDADVGPVDVGAFFGEVLPDLVNRRGELVRDGARELRLRPFAARVDGRSWTLSFDGEHVTVDEGDGAAAAVMVLSSDDLADLVHDVRTPMSFFTGGELHLERGRLEDSLDWWVVLRSLLDERPVHATGAIDFRDPAGRPLDLHRTFVTDDADDEMAHFLTEAGFLHVTGVFTEEEMAQVSADMDAAAPSYQPDDGNSWWAKTHDGDNRLVRMQRFQEHSATTAALLGDERLARLAGLTGDDHHQPAGDRGGNLVEALVKPIGVVEGISDVPWHKDCSLGLHSFRCCSLVVGISVTGADAASGQLRVIAGSHRALVQPAFVRRELDLPPLDLPTATGDITVHLSCTLHMSQPPVERERRVLYTALRLPDREGSSREGLDTMYRVREGAYKTVSQRPGHVA
jgi:hypothetical protein